MLQAQEEWLCSQTRLAEGSTSFVQIQLYQPTEVLRLSSPTYLSKKVNKYNSKEELQDRERKEE